MGMLGPPPSRAQAPAEAGRALESLFLQQIFHASGAFKAGNAAGAQLRNDLFVEVLGDAVARSGSLGLGKQLQAALGSPGHPPPGHPPAATPAHALEQVVGGAQRPELHSALKAYRKRAEESSSPARLPGR